MHGPTASTQPAPIALLGPTNTGKTHYAVERMLGHASGMMGFPLRLLAREIYDRVVAIKGARQVALVTGEEKIVPDRAAYWICTVESMPMSESVDFMAVDEVQLAADPQRGHIFTHRLLHARGVQETILMGADTVRPLLRRLLPDAHLESRQRLSQLRYAEPRKLDRLPRRSAIVTFRAEDVYGLAELIRRSRGGAAVVMGALSPRTRNAQVEMYQNGDVDYLVATDAIGMGLNMDIDHVAFAATEKFDGWRRRALTPAEIGQIAGRAGRHMSDGNFSTVANADAAALPRDTIARIEDHRFQPLRALYWRNARLNFGSLGQLIVSLETDPAQDGLIRMRAAQDLQALRALAHDPAVVAAARSPAALQRLWEVCQVPDFRRISEGEHLSLLRRLYTDLMGPRGKISTDWIARNTSRLDNPQGDIDTLAGRIAGIRTWTYVANRKDWLEDAGHWAQIAREIEDRLSDALHDRLTQRFVDRRTSVLMRQLRQRGELSVSIEDSNDIIVEGHAIGRLDGFTFTPDPAASGEDHKLLELAADRVLKSELSRRAKIFLNIGHQTLALDFAQGLMRPRLLWKDTPIAVIERGDEPLAPRVRLLAGTRLADPEAEAVRAKCAAWLEARMADKLAPLMALQAEMNSPAAEDGKTAPLRGLARGIAFRLLESFGALPRNQVANDLRKVDQEARKGLRRFGIRIGATSLYIPPLLKPHAVELRLMLWALWHGHDTLPALPTPGLVWISTDPAAPREFYEIAGFRLIGNHEAVRSDMLERLADAVRPLGKDGAEFTVSPDIMGLIGCSGDSFASAMRLLGYAYRTETVPAEALKAATDVSSTGDTAPGKAHDEQTAEQAAPPADAAVVDAHVSETSSETGAGEAAAGGAAPAAVDSSDSPSSPSAQAEQTVERYLFKWSPQGGRAGGERRGRRKTGHGSAATVKTGGKPSGKPSDNHTGAPTSKRGARSGDRAGSGNTPARGNGKPSRKQSPPAKPVDPDSPFAQLQSLKDALEKKKK